MTLIYYTRRVKEAIHPNNINRDSGKGIPEAWMPTIKKYNNRRAMRQRTAEGANLWVKQQGSKYTNQSCWKTTNHSRASCFIRSRMTSRPYRLKKTSSMQSKRRDLHHTWLHRETNDKLSFHYLISFKNVSWNHELLVIDIQKAIWWKWKRKVNSDFEGSIVINAVTKNGLLRPIKSVLLDAPKSESFKEKE